MGRAVFVFAVTNNRAECGMFGPWTPPPTSPPVPVEHNDPVNAQILAVSEDKIAGFRASEPFQEIARLSGVANCRWCSTRIRAMLRAGTIRRVRQTLLATNLASGALAAWKLPPEKLDAAFDFMFREDPFSGHVVLRSTDGNHGRFRVQALDHDQSPARVFACTNTPRCWPGTSGRNTSG